MIGDEEAQWLHSTEDYAKIIKEIFAVEEIVGCKQEVPGETSKPWQTVNAINLITNRDDFLKAFYLYGECLKMWQILIEDEQFLKI